MGVTLHLILGILLILSHRSLSKDPNSSLIRELSATPVTPLIQNVTEINNRDLNKILIDNPKTDNLDSKAKFVNNVHIFQDFQTKVAKNKNVRETGSSKNASNKNKTEETESTETLKKYPSEKLREEKAIDTDHSKFWSDFHSKNIFTSRPNADDKLHKVEDLSFDLANDSELYPKLDLTTPQTEHFDQKFKETVESIQQKLDEHTDEDDESEEDEDEFKVEEFLKKPPSNGSLEIIKTKALVNNETVNKNSIHKDLNLEQNSRINYEHSFNDTKSYDISFDKGEVSEENGSTKKTTSTTLPTVLPTTRKSSLIKESASEKSNHILSNNIEVETINPIKSTTDFISSDNPNKLKGDVQITTATSSTTIRTETPKEGSAVTTTTTVATQVPKTDSSYQENITNSLKVESSSISSNTISLKTISAEVENETNNTQQIPTGNFTIIGRFGNTTTVQNDTPVSLKTPTTTTESYVTTTETTSTVNLPNNIIKHPTTTTESSQIVSTTTTALDETTKTLEAVFMPSTIKADTGPSITTRDASYATEENSTVHDNNSSEITTTTTSESTTTNISETTTKSALETTTMSMLETTGGTHRTSKSLENHTPTIHLVEGTNKAVNELTQEYTNIIYKNTTMTTVENKLDSTTTPVVKTTIDDKINVIEKERTTKNNATGLLITSDNNTSLSGITKTTVHFVETTTEKLVPSNTFEEKTVVTTTNEILTTTTFKEKIPTTTMVPSTTTNTPTTTQRKEPIPISTENAFNHLEHGDIDNGTTPILNFSTPSIDPNVNESIKIKKIVFNKDTETNYISSNTSNKTASSTSSYVTTPSSTTSSIVTSTGTTTSTTTTSEVPGNITTTDEDTDTTPTENKFKGDGSDKGKIAAITISCVGAVCLVLLAGLLYVMKKRQRRLNYGPRCRPVSLDDYSIDNLSVYNSVRRKAGARMSKRSFGNPAFEDPASPSHPLNFPALAKFSTNLEDIKAEFEDIPQIHARTSELPEGCETKNRYANVIPLPETRVYLQTIDGYPNSDYINANYVTGPKDVRAYYIATQAPMQNTVDDFWRMVWEQQARVILMLTHLIENGLEKCVDYLPESEVVDCSRLFGDFQIILKKREVKEKYIISCLQLKNMVSNSWREVTHFWYLGWPEKGVPIEANSLIAFLIEARSYMKVATIDKKDGINGVQNGGSYNEQNPVVVHCSPGTGRTGVAIACDIAIREFETTRLVDIPKIVYRIRRDRANAVQTKEQYQFIYKVVSLYATKLTGGALDNLE